MSDLFESELGQTPLDVDEREALIPSHVRQRSELNEFEATNILKAQQKYFLRKRRQGNLKEPELLKSIHREMFDLTWKWAGNFRLSNKNLGVDWWKIPEEIKKTCDDFCYWKENEIFAPNEIAVRFHHRLVCVHAFPNGNGRHARFVADLFMLEMGEAAFTWGAKKLVQQGISRQKYIQALQSADRGNFAELIQFVVS